jgi:hypothetical protein
MRRIHHRLETEGMSARLNGAQKQRWRARKSNFERVCMDKDLLKAGEDDIVGPRKSDPVVCGSGFPFNLHPFAKTCYLEAGSLDPLPG